MEVNEITEVISSAKFIATHSESVSVCEKGIKRGAELVFQRSPAQIIIIIFHTRYYRTGHWESSLLKTII